MNYLRYWALRRRPFLFDQGADFFLGTAQREALAGVNYFVASPDKLATLVCSRQNGLSWLLSHVQQLRGVDDRAVEFVLTPGDLPDRRQMESNLCAALGFTSVCDNHESLIHQSVNVLRQQNMRLVWLVDQCCSATVRIVQEIVRPHRDVQILFGLDPNAIDQSAQYLGQVPMRIDLAPLTIDETCNYARFCIERAAGDRSILPDSTAIRLHEVTGGILGSVATAAESALALAASHRLDQVTPAVVEAFAEQQSQAA